MNFDVKHLILYTTFISISVSLFLALYMGVQAVLIKRARLRFIFFLSTWAYLALVDIGFLLQTFDIQVYELCRITWGITYVFALMNFFEVKTKSKIVVSIVLITAAATSWMTKWQLASSLTFPIVFGMGALLHLRHFRKTHGFASIVLTAFSGALAIMCALYALVAANGTQAVMMGYAHYAAISLTMVVFGWIQFPRELLGGVPVKIKPLHAKIVVSTVLAFEIINQWNLVSGHISLAIYSSCLMFQLGAVITLYFAHRHDLVVYTNNVARLLDERTHSLQAAEADLKSANEELYRHSEDLETLLESKISELQGKANVIERQRRVELAAQTAGEVAHDIQNSIAPMFNIIRQIDDEVHASGRLRELTMRMRNLVETTLEMNGQILALSRRGVSHKHLINLNELIDEISNLYPLNDIDTTQIRGDYWVLGTWAQLHRALNNLVVNAIEATDQPNSIHINTEAVSIDQPFRCHLGIVPPGDYVCLTVKDHGPRIPNKLIDRIFEPFFSSKSRERRSGSGLGLSIVAGVIEDMGGILDLHTNLLGTTFSIYFPAAAAPEGSSLSETVLQNVTVLVVDDDSQVRIDLEQALTKVGCHVQCAIDGAEALKTLQIASFDVIILDNSMPHLGGIEALFGIRHICPAASVIIYSRYLTDDEEKKYCELGVEAFLTKPSPTSEILAVIAQIAPTRRLTLT